MCHTEVLSSASKTVNDGKLSKNNVKLVSGALLTGAGFEGYKRAATLLNTKPLACKAFEDTEICRRKI